MVIIWFLLSAGIGYILLKNTSEISKTKLRDLCGMFNLPAFWAIVNDKNKITPAVYVKDTNSMTYESACGSGSIALNILKNINSVIQPTGEIITVSRKENYFTISAKVIELPLRKTQKNDTLMEATI